MGGDSPPWGGGGGLILKRGGASNGMHEGRCGKNLSPEFLGWANIFPGGAPCPPPPPAWLYGPGTAARRPGSPKKTTLQINVHHRPHNLKVLALKSYRHL